MGPGRREKDIKLLVAKFVKLVESLNPGERLSIKKVAAKRRPAARSQARKTAVKGAAKAADRAGKAGGKAPSTRASR
jgi:hypothetical protein